MAKVPGRPKLVSSQAQPSTPAGAPPPEPYIAMALSTMQSLGRLASGQPTQPQSPPAGSPNPILGIRD